MKNIKLQVIIPEKFIYKNLYINGRNSIFQNWNNKMKIKKIDENIHFITFNIMETYLEYKLSLETENGDCYEENNRFINIIYDCSINNIFYDLNMNDVAIEYAIEPMINQEPEPKIVTINNYPTYNDYKKTYSKKTSSNNYHLVSGYDRGDTHVKAYARGKVPASLKKKTIVSGYTKKDGTKVKAYTRKK